MKTSTELISEFYQREYDRLRSDTKPFVEVLAMADRTNLDIISIERTGAGVRIDLGGDYGMRVTLEGGSRRVAAYLNRMRALGSQFDVEPPQRVNDVPGPADTINPNTPEPEWRDE